MSAIRSQACSPLLHRAPPHLPLIPLQGKLQERATSFRVAAHRWKNVSLASCEIFPPCTHLVLPSTIAANRLDSSHSLEVVTLLMEDLYFAAAYLSGRVMASGGLGLLYPRLLNGGGRPRRHP